MWVNKWTFLSVAAGGVGCGVGSGVKASRLAQTKAGIV